jgi:predicted enzyme related to lactoylglutathione lyase
LGRGWVAWIPREWQGGGVPTRLVHLVIDAADPPRLARFWSAALGWVVAAGEPAEAVVWPSGYQYPDPVALPLVFVPVAGAKRGKNRVHLDLATESAGHQAAEVERLRGLGAAPADIGQGDVPWVVMADPEGNEFCVLDPRPAYHDTGPVAAIVSDCADPVALAGFWELAAGWVPGDPAEGWVPLRSPQGVGPYLELLRVPDPNAVKNRMHLDIAPNAGEDHLAAVRLLREAGAVPIDISQGDVPWAVLADPQGGEFCVLTPR